MTLIFVDVEAVGPSVSTGRMTEFGAVEFNTRRSFHGILDKEVALHRRPDVGTGLTVKGETYRHNLVIVSDGGRDSTLSETAGDAVTVIGYVNPRGAFAAFDQWLGQFPSPLIFVSDNPAYDWQWINDAFHLHVGRNPFGHSARRIGDFYAGLERDWRAASRWKKYRRTPHDHDPVHDSQGNVEAFAEILLIHGDVYRDPKGGIDGITDLRDGLCFGREATR